MVGKNSASETSTTEVVTSVQRQTVTRGVKRPRSVDLSTVSEPQTNGTIAIESEEEGASLFSGSSSNTAGRSAVTNDDVWQSPTEVRDELLASPDENNEGTIAQWYADPYRRVDTSGPTHDQQRRRYFEALLTGKGYTKAQIRLVTKWLMNCRQGYQVSNVTKHDNRRRGLTTRRYGNRGRATKRTLPPSQQKPLAAQSRSRSRTVCPEISRNQASNDEAEEAEEEDGDEDEDEDEDEDAELTPEAEEQARALLRVPSEDQPTIEASPPSKRGRKALPEYTEDQQIEMLRARIDIFDIIYGDNLPSPDDSIEVDYLHYSTPKTINSRSMRSQPAPFVHTVEHNGRKVYTEDPSFGLLYIPPHERALKVKADQDSTEGRPLIESGNTQRPSVLVKREPGRLRAKQETADQDLLKDAQPFSTGYRQRWKELDSGH